jgi:hypothetical protein
MNSADGQDRCSNCQWKYPDRCRECVAEYEYYLYMLNKSKENHQSIDSILLNTQADREIADLMDKNQI